MADRAAREGCGPCAAKQRAREAAAKKGSNSGQTKPEKSEAEVLINTRPGGR